MSIQLIEELETVLARPAFRDRLGDESIARFLLGLHSIAELVDDPPPAEEQVSRDPDDDYLIALARAAHVDGLVSGDRDLLVLDDPAHPVWTPATFLARLGDPGDS
jgi:putative PIN family toxin of toxin-antitoxin system